MKTKKIDTVIQGLQAEIEMLRRVKSNFPDAEFSVIEDGSRVFISSEVLQKHTGFHFSVQKDQSGSRILMRPFLDMKRRGKDSIRVYAPQSCIVPTFAILVDMLNQYGRNVNLSTVPNSAAELFGKVS